MTDNALLSLFPGWSAPDWPSPERPVYVPTWLIGQAGDLLNDSLANGTIVEVSDMRGKARRQLSPDWWKGEH